MSNKQSLLEKAQSFPTNRRKNEKISDDLIELSLAWMKGEVRVVEIKYALDKKSNSNIYQCLTLAFREAYTKGKIKIIE